MSKRVGFVGLGIMGRPMALNVLRAGFPLTVWNRTAARMKPLVDAGARAAGSPSEAASRSDIIVTIVSDTPDVEQVILGHSGVLEGAAPGSIIADMSTISPSVTRRIAETCRAKGVQMLDAPVSGGEVGAVAGTLSIMAGGDEKAFESAKPVFSAMGKTITYCGSSGCGQGTKLCNQVIGSLNNLAMCEGLALAIRLGLDPKKVIQAVGAGAASNWALLNLGPKVLAGDYRPGFMVKLNQKDLKLVLDAARESGASLPGTGLVNQLFNSVAANGGGELGIQSLFTVIAKLSGFQPPGT